MSRTTTERIVPDLQVIVAVRGGIADVLFKSAGVVVAVYDYDVQGADERADAVVRDPDGQLCTIKQWGNSKQVVDCPHWPVAREVRQAEYRRTWRCPICGRRLDCSYEALATAGAPLCADCDEEMELL